MKNKCMNTLTELQIPDRVSVPIDTILVITDHQANNWLVEKLIEPLKGKPKRAWFVNHAYYCLPLIIGNQYGFIVKSLYDFWATWNGGDRPTDVSLRTRQEDSDLLDKQFVAAHFGMGIITIQNRWVFRTPPEINLLTVNPPNYWIDGVSHMSAVVETDNLRRDFTFNLKITRVDSEIFIPAGSPIGCILPFPRHFIDNYKLCIAEDFLPAKTIKDERLAQRDFGTERRTDKKTKRHGVGRRYYRGQDVYGFQFRDHQTRLDE